MAVYSANLSYTKVLNLSYIWKVLKFTKTKKQKKQKKKKKKKEQYSVVNNFIPYYGFKPLLHRKCVKFPIDRGSWYPPSVWISALWHGIKLKFSYMLFLFVFFFFFF